MIKQGSRTRAEEARPLTARLRAAEVIERHRIGLRENAAHALAGRDPEGVHDMRVASRRLRAALEFFASWLDDGPRRRIERDVRAITRALGQVRELDVLRLKLSLLAEKAPPAGALALEHLDGHVFKQIRHARTRMMRRFARVDLARLDLRLKRLVATLSRPPRVPATIPAAPPILPVVVEGEPPAWRPNETSPSSAPEFSGNGLDLRAMGDPPVARVARAIAPRLVETAREVIGVELTSPAGSEASAQALHGARIAAKKLRYELEIVALCLPGEGRDLLRTLKRLQDALGRFHDDAVLNTTLGGFIEDAESRERPLLAGELRRLRASCRRMLLGEERRVAARLKKLEQEGFPEVVGMALEAAAEPSPAEGDELSP